MFTKTFRLPSLVITLVILSGCSVLAAVMDSSELSAIVTESVLFDFTDSSTSSRWFQVNDDVMGGVSQSNISFTTDGTALFSGKISFENNGGFASVQSDFVPPLDLSNYTGLEFRVKGDGKKYGIYLWDRRGFVTYESTFQSEAGVWQSVRLPFKSFYPVYNGIRTTATPLDLSRIRAITVMIEYKQEGPFALEIARISSYQDE